MYLAFTITIALDQSFTFLYLMDFFANRIYIFRSNDILHNFSNDFLYVSVANR